MPEEVDRYPNNPLDGPAQFKDFLAGLERRIAGMEGAVTAGGVPVGVMFATRNPGLDAGYLWCDGAAIPAEHTALIAICGPNTPDYRGRTFVGLDNIGGSDAGRLSVANTLGGSGGTQTVTILEANLPSALWINAGAFAVQGGAGLTIRLTAGGSTPIDNMPPFALCNVIIKY